MYLNFSVFQSKKLARSQGNNATEIDKMPL